MFQILTQSLNAAEIQNMQIKDKELERERERERERKDRHKAIYIGSSYNTGVV